MGRGYYAADESRELFGDLASDHGMDLPEPVMSAPSPPPPPQPSRNNNNSYSSNNNSSDAPVKGTNANETTSPAPAASSSSASISSPTADKTHVRRLQTAKQLLDKGLISEAE